MQVWSETKVLPTYPVGKPSDFPEFTRSSGLTRVGPGMYPYTFQRDLSFDRRDEGYQTLVLQNEYLRVEVLPTLGGRMFSMQDRVTGQEIVYRQVSIKPGLVALRGAWICGGIEWNFPRSHSVTTFDTVSYRLIRHEDGSASIVIGDTERTFHMSWTVELRLRPGQAKIETHIVCQNLTNTAHDGYWWTNASFPANDQLQLIYPFNKVTGHEAAGASDWPTRDGKDMTWYRDYAASTSTFRASGEEDFIAAYDHGRDVGLAQFADRHAMPGRKWFTWGAGEGGLRWAKTLSDDNRPYVEVQSGDPLTQSQQFHMQPHEEKQYLEYWMPVTRIGAPSRINPDAILHLGVDKDVASVGVLPTSRIANARIELSAGDRVIKQWRKSISPAEIFKDTCPLNGASPDSIWLRVFDAHGREVIAHQNGHYAKGPLLVEATTRPEGQDRPDRRSAVSSRSNRSEPEADKLSPAVTQLGQGQYQQAKDTLEKLATSPEQGVDADAVRYYLALAMAGLDQADEAMRQWDAIQKPGEVRDAATIEAAKLLIRQGHFTEAIARLKPLTEREPCHVTATALTALAMRQMSQGAAHADWTAACRTNLNKALQRDPLSLLAQTEQALLEGRSLDNCSALRDEERRIEAATMYLAVKDYATAERLLSPPAGGSASATASYLRAYVAGLKGDTANASRLRVEAARATVRGCLPARLEELSAFESAIAANDNDAAAHYLAGLVLVAKGRKDDGQAQWRRSAELGLGDAVVYRCLGDALRDKNPQEAVTFFEQAAERAPDAPEVYTDLDYAYLRLGETAKRVEVLQRGLARLPGRDELAHRLGVACFDAGRYDDAIQCYQSLRFHVAEGQRDLHDNYAIALVGRAMTRLQENRAKEALADLDAAMEYPENLGIGRPERGANSATVQFWRGVALEKLGQAEEANKAFQEAARPNRMQRRGYMSPDSGVQVVHAVMAARRLGQEKEALDAAAQVNDLCRRAESMDPAEGKAYATMLRGYLAAANGQADEANRLLQEVMAKPSRSAGYARLTQTWVELLRRDVATMPCSMPAVKVAAQ